MRRVLAIGIAALGLCAWQGARGHEFKPGSDYINPAAPEVKIPEYKGQRYTAYVPDTIDIAQSAKLAIRGMTSPVDRNRDFALYWEAHYFNNPGHMTIEDYTNIATKYMEALPLLRIATGSSQNAEVDQVWLNAMVKRVGPDGLLYMRGANDQFTPLGGVGTSRLIRTMLVQHLRDGDPRWQEIIERLITRLSELAIVQGDTAFFPGYNVPAVKPPDNSLAPKGAQSMDYPHGRLIEALGHYYRKTGYEPARELGDKFVNYALKRSEYWGENGEWLRDQWPPEQNPNREKDVHFGTHSHLLVYLTDYAVSTNNTELLDFCRKSFDWGKMRNSTIAGQSETATTIGFFVEFLNPYYLTNETCATADMIAIGIKLSQAGKGDSWDEVDGWIRNQFIENQMTYSQWARKLPYPSEDIASDSISTTNVAARNVGTFFSWAAANDGVPDGRGHMHCCMGNAARTLYYIWENMAEEKDGGLKVNLLMNRALRSADVNSHIPHSGRVDVIAKQPLNNVALHLPAWVRGDEAGLKCYVNDQPRELQRNGRYVETGAVRAGDVVRLEFPIEITKLEEKPLGGAGLTVLGAKVYDELVFKGNTLISIKPEGVTYPYYQRNHFRQAEPDWVKVERFISDEKIEW